MKKHLPIGIDINGNGVHALQLTANDKGLNIRAAAQVPMQKRLGGSLDDLDALGAVIKQLKDQRLFKGKRAVVSLPQEYLHVFPVTVKANGHSPFETLLAQASGKHLAFPLEQAVLDYFSVEENNTEDGRQLRVTIVAAHREQVLKVIQTCKSAGRLVVAAIDYALCGLVRLHNHIHALCETPIVLMHMDDESTMLAVAAKAKILAHRQLDWGFGRLHRRIAETLHLDAESQQPQSMLRHYGVDYDAFKERNGQPDQKEVHPHSGRIAALRVTSQIIVPSMEELVRELYQIIGYARSVSPDIRFQTLWLYGMANNINNIGPFLEKRLHIPVQRMKPFHQIGLQNMEALEPGQLNSFIGALGLALREAV
jgi:type IV pilus assembly protein PilM